MNYETIRKDCCQANKALPETGLVDLTFGNVSVFDPSAKVFAIKPSGVPYDQLTPESMVILDLEGEIIEGSYRPSSDTPTHRYLFKQWHAGGLTSIVHTHSRNAVAFAQAAQAIPCLGTTHSDYFHGSIPLTRTMKSGEVETDYEWNTGKVIAECFEKNDPLMIPAVLVRNHGPFAWGSSAEKAVETAQALEIVSEMALKSLQLRDGAASVPPYLLDKHFYRKHGTTAYYGQPKKP
ncbi:MAG: L-ribulose-5-phosphate 4-epimerase AraD [Verrucomicrobiota bacterium]